jgi:hypothetical protein
MKDGMRKQMSISRALDACRIRGIRLVTGANGLHEGLPYFVEAVYNRTASIFDSFTQLFIYENRRNQDEWLSKMASA